MVVLPLFISPITIEGIALDEEEVNTIIQFETAKNVTTWQILFTEELEPSIKDEIELWGEPLFPDFKLDLGSNHDVYLLEFNQTSQKNILELNVEGALEGMNADNIDQFNTAYDGLLGQMITVVVNFLVANNATDGTSFTDFKSGEVITDEF